MTSRIRKNTIGTKEQKEEESTVLAGIVGTLAGILRADRTGVRLRFLGAEFIQSRAALTEEVDGLDDVSLDIIHSVIAIGLTARKQCRFTDVIHAKVQDLLSKLECLETAVVGVRALEGRANSKTQESLCGECSTRDGSGSALAVKSPNIPHVGASHIPAKPRVQTPPLQTVEAPPHEDIPVRAHRSIIERGEIVYCRGSDTLVYM
jgi:hypothetical protein